MFFKTKKHGLATMLLLRIFTNPYLNLRFLAASDFFLRFTLGFS